jgi:prephenate dehydrogenase
VRVALLGTGLIGGSIGLALRRVEEIDRIVAYDRDARSCARAVERGAADAAADTASAAVRDAGLVFVATPVRAIPSVLSEAVSGLKRGTIVTDVGSTKSRVVLEVERILPEGVPFIGGHPMAGTEEEGIEAAKPGLFEGAWWILTPTERADPESYRRLHGIIGRLGAQVMALDPARHDELMALISHLPHLTATVLMNLAAERGREHAGLLALAAGGFRDVTRVAASNPEIWLDICRENHEAIAEIIETFADRLLEIRDLVKQGTGADLRSLFLSARESRRNLPGKPLEGDLVEIHVPVPDRPGVLAEVTTLVGDLGINIENLEISHSAEGGRGVLHLSVLGVDKAKSIVTALQSKGYEPRSTSL